MGATSPEEYGDYFAWGETSPKEDYRESTYKYYSSATWIDPDGLPIDDPGYTKYVTKESAIKDGYHDTFDDKTQLDKEDDVASMNWGGKWRMPRIEEFYELVEKCTWSWVTISGVNVYKVTGPSGNYIYLPAAGSRYSSRLYSEGSFGYYWSSSLNSSVPTYACNLYFDSYGRNVGNVNRYNGFTVRPVSE